MDYLEHHVPILKFKPRASQWTARAAEWYGDRRTDFPNGKNLQLGDDMAMLKEEKQTKPQCLKVTEHLEQEHLL